MKEATPDTPLVSFCLTCYNQRQYIDEAVKAALAQTYSPLEIVISDDSSKDGTWERIQELCQAYDGPHRLILNHNEQNIGIVGNCQKMFSLAHGELFVKADGDDISLPHRVEAIVRDWVATGKEAVMLCSSYSTIDVNGKEMARHPVPFVGWDTRSDIDQCRGNGYVYIGAAFAVKRCLLDDFGPIEYPGACDDTVYTGRAIMTGRSRTVEDDLVRYRVGSGVSTSKRNYRQTTIRGQRLIMDSQLQNLKDLEFIRQRLSPETYLRHKQMFEDYIRHFERSLKLWEGKSFRERLKGFRDNGGGTLSKSGIMSLIALLPAKIADMIIKFIFSVKRVL